MHDDATARRFWAKVDRDGPTPAHDPALGPCWVWTRARFRRSDYGTPTYGMFDIKGKRRPAHQVAWELAEGPIPHGLLVLHRCDNKPCIRRTHLYLGTHLDNMRDAADRHRMPERERNPKSKLTEADVQEIRRLWNDGETQATIAARFGVWQGTVNHIITGRNWRSLPGVVTRRGKPRSQTLTNAEVEAVVAEFRAGGVSQATLARRLGLSRPTVTRWINDPRHVPAA